MSSSLDFRGVCMVGPRAIEETFAFLTLHFPVGWTGIVGRHRTGRTTLLRLAAGEVAPARGQVRVPGEAMYCGRDLTRPPARLAELLGTPDRVAAQLVGRMGLEEDLVERWGELEMSMRRRAQVACALWADPAVLCLDEPTEGVDTATRELLIALLARFRGIGLVTSNDREPLDRLSTTCLLLGHGTPVLRKGNYSEARTLFLREQEILRRQKQNAQRELAALAATVDERRHEAEQANAKRSKRLLDIHDHDARQKLDRARKSGKDSRAGQQLKQLSGRLAQAQERVEAIAVEEGKPWPEHVTGEPAATEVIGRVGTDGPEIRREDRIGLSSVTGKGGWEPVAERLHRAHGVRVLHVPPDAGALADQLEVAWPKLTDGQREDARAAAAFLGYTVPEAITVAELHPDELWKLVFATGVAAGPNLVVLEYPERVLDLPAIEQLEGALRRCRCALVVVSADAMLLRNVTGHRWQLLEDGHLAVQS